MFAMLLVKIEVGEPGRAVHDPLRIETKSKIRRNIARYIKDGRCISIDYAQTKDAYR